MQKRFGAFMRTKLMKNVSCIVAPLGVGISGTGGGIGLWMLKDKSSLSDQLNDWEEKLLEEKTRHSRLNQEQQRLLQRLGNLRKIKMNSSDSIIQNLEQQIRNHQQSSSDFDSLIKKLESKDPENKARIEDLTKQVSSEKDSVANEKQKVGEKTSQITSNTRLITEREGIISSKENTIGTKSKEISTLRSSTNTYSGLLSNFHRQILVENAPKYDFTKPINFSNVELLQFEKNGDGSVNISLGNGQKKVDIKNLKTANLLDKDGLVKRFKEGKSGYAVLGSISTGNKKIKLWLNTPVKEYLVKDSKRAWEIDLKTIFKEGHMSEVAKVLHAMEVLTNFQASQTLTGAKQSVNTQVGDNKGLHPEKFSIQGNIFSNKFSDKDDFLKYLVSKVFELIYFKKVDFSDILDPVFKEVTYKKTSSDIQSQARS